MASSLPGLILNPLITGPLWLALTAPQTREKAIEFLSTYIPPSLLEILAHTFKYLTLIGLTLWASHYLSTLAQNNFRLSSERHRYDWPNEIAVITGGTGGFGSLMSKSLAAAGLTIICIDIADTLPADMQGNPKIHYYKCDITDPSAVKALANQVRTEHGDPKILINNAGVAGDHTVLTATPEELTRVFNVNIISHYYTLQAFLPAMIADKKGHIVSLASLASFISNVGLHSYSGTKAAVLALHEGLGQELRVLHNAPEIKLTIVHPTFAATGMTAPFREKIEGGGAVMLDPRVVSEAVVRQVLGGRGGQIVIAPGFGWLRGLRAWPQWVQQGVMRVSDVGVDKGLRAKAEAEAGKARGGKAE